MESSVVFLPDKEQHNCHDSRDKATNASDNTDYGDSARDNTMGTYAT